MKSVTPVARLSMAAGVLAAVLVYLVVLEIGMNAGRIHRGVRVGAVELGGLTKAEGTARLGEFADRNSTTRIVFTSADGEVNPFVFTPSDLGWRPKLVKAIEEAYAVGRSGSPWTAARQRLAAWTSGVEVSLGGFLEFPLVNRRIHAVAVEAADAGLRVKKGKLIFLIRRAIRDWPKKESYSLPLASIS